LRLSDCILDHNILPTKELVRYFDENNLKRERSFSFSDIPSEDEEEKKELFKKLVEKLIILKRYGIDDNNMPPVKEMKAIFEKGVTKETKTVGKQRFRNAVKKVELINHLTEKNCIILHDMAKHNDDITNETKTRAKQRFANAVKKVGLINHVVEQDRIAPVRDLASMFDKGNVTGAGSKIKSNNTNEIKNSVIIDGENIDFFIQQKQFAVGEEKHTLDNVKKPKKLRATKKPQKTKASREKINSVDSNKTRAVKDLKGMWETKTLY